MPDLRSTGVFADSSASDGLYRGLYIAAGVGVPNTKVPGTPAHYLSQTEVVTYWNDFRTLNDDFDLTNLWESNDIGTVTVDPSTFIITNSGKGSLRLIADATIGDGNSVSLSRADALLSAVTPTANSVITFECSVALSDVETSHWFAGLSEDQEAVDMIGTTTGDMHASKEYIGFHYNNDDDVIGIPDFVVAGLNNTEVTVTTDHAFTASVDTEYRRFGFRIAGTDGVEFYVDGIKRGEAVVDSAFAAPLAISFAAVNDAGVADTFDIDWVLVSQTR